MTARPALVLALALAATTAGPATGQDSAPLERAAAEWLNLLRSERFDSAAARVAAVARSTMSAEQLATVWPRILQQFGALEKTVPIDRTGQGDYTVVQLLGTFARGPRTIRIVFDRDGRIAGFRILDPPAGGIAPRPAPPSAGVRRDR